MAPPLTGCLSVLAAAATLLAAAASAKVLVAVPEGAGKTKAKPQDVCQFRLTGGGIALTTRLPVNAKAGYQPLEIEGWGGSGSFQNRETTFRLNYNIQKGNGNSYFNVYRVGNFLQITRTDSVPDRNLTVALTQGVRAGAGAGDDRTARFSVREMNPQTGQVTTTIEFSAKDMATLRRERPKELREHLVPLLKMFGSYGLGVDAALARQVLVEHAIDAAFRQKVRTLVVQLDADAFPDREAAAESLRKLGGEGAAVLRTFDRKELTEQQKLTIDAILKALEQLTPQEVAHLRRDKDFLLDCLYCEDPAMRELAVDRLSKLLGKKIDIDPKADPEKNADAIEALRAAK